MVAVNLGLPRSASLRDAPGAAAAPSLDGRPDVRGLVDRFGRVARDLRVSVTEKCSLRCTYCMPPDFSTRVTAPTQPLCTSSSTRPGSAGTSGRASLRGALRSWGPHWW